MALNDTFADALGTLLTAHTSDSGHGWAQPSVAAGQFTIGEPPDAPGTHMAYCSTIGSLYADWTPAGDDYEVTFAIHQNGSTTSIGVLVRFDPALGNGYLFNFPSGSTDVQFRPITGGTLGAILATGTYVIGNGNTSVFRAEVVGTTYSLYDDATDTLIVAGTDATYSAAGRVGLRASQTGASNRLIASISTWEPPINVAPVVDAGADETITIADTFTRTATFIDGDGVSTSWTATVDYGEGAGPVAASVDGVAKTVALSNLYETAGVYTVTVTVTDDGGMSHSDSFTLTVNPAPTLGRFLVLATAGTDATAPAVTIPGTALQGGLARSLADTLYPDKAATEAALGRVDPGAAGSAGKALVHGPSGPTWADQWFNVKAYGAKGDFVADDTAAIQAAIDAANAAGGGTVFVPVGQYKITSTLLLYSGVVLAGAGRRRSRIRTASTTITAITVHGTSAAATKVQWAIRDLGIIGPSSGTGIGVSIKWCSFGWSLTNVHVYGWGSHGVKVEDSYTGTFQDVQFDTNGGDGFHALTNINNISWINCTSGLNGARGYYVAGGTTGYFINADAEDNQGAGFDLRYCYAYVIQGHMEGNGHDGTSPNIYIHQRNSAAEPSNSVKVQSCIIQGAGTTVTGVKVDGATQSYIGDGNWFAGHLTQDIEIMPAASRTMIGVNGGAADLTITDNDTTTARLDYAYNAFAPRVSPGLLLTPRSTNPPGLATGGEGTLWYDSVTKKLEFWDGAAVRTVTST